MELLNAPFAVPKGILLCLFEPKVRRFAMWPWLIGAITYIASLIAVYYLHPIVLNSLVAAPVGIWASALFYLAWFAVGVFLLMLSMFLSMIFVLIFTAVFQTEIATAVLKLHEKEVPKTAEGVSGIIKDGGRAIATESGKMLWMVPLFLVILLLGFIPFLTPFAFFANAWLLSYQFVDIVLDIYRTTARQRFKFALKHSLIFGVFGMTLTFFWAIPFLGILLPPAAVAGATWLLAESDVLDNLE